jgi:phosphoribosylformylglycinamidine synthase
VIQNHAQQKVLTKDAVCDRKDLPLCAKNLDAHTDLKNNITLEHFVEKYPHLFVSLYAHPANASRAPVYHNYCSTVQGNTVAGSGALQMAAAGVVRLPKHVQQDHHNHTATPGILGLALAAGCEERWVELNPFEGTALSVLKIARKLVATGAKPLAMTNCLNFGNPQSPTVMRQLCDAIEGMNYVAKNLHIPVVSSNVSLNNQTHEQAIAPTPMVGLVGTIPDLSHVPLAALPKQYFKKHEQPLSLVHVFHQDGPHISSYLASQTAWILGGENSCCPKFNLVCEKALWDFIFTTLTHHKPKVCVPIGHGGLLGTLITLSLNSVAPLELEKLMWQHKAQDLFREGSLGFVLGFSSLEQTERFLQQSDDHTFHKVLVGQLKPQHCKIQKPLFHFDTVEKEYAFALQRYFSPQPWGHREAT